MTAEQMAEELRLRPHNILCAWFISVESPERGEAFDALGHKIREAMEAGSDALVIEIVPGFDDLCRVCPLYRDGRCESPQGDETEGQKWDALIMRGLGLSYGDRLSAKRFSAVIREKAPLPVCRTRCQYRQTCHVFSVH